MSQPDQIDLTAEEKSYLQALIDTKKVSPRVSDRAKILLLRSEGVSPSEIRRKLHMLSKPVRLCLDKFKEGGLMRALQDDQRSGHPKEISEEAALCRMTSAAAIQKRSRKKPCSGSSKQLKNLHELWGMSKISGQSLYFTNMCSSTQKRRVFQGWSASLLRPCPGS